MKYVPTILVWIAALLALGKWVIDIDKQMITFATAILLVFLASAVDPSSAGDDDLVAEIDLEELADRITERMSRSEGEQPHQMGPRR